MKKKDKGYIAEIVLIIGILLFVFISIRVIENRNSMELSYLNNSIKQYSLLIIDKNETTLIIYPNGTIWQKNGSEEYNGEQLAKLSTSYSNFINEYCDNREKSK